MQPVPDRSAGGARRAPRLHRPARGLAAAVEVLAAVALLVTAVECWRRGLTPVSYPLGDAVQRITVVEGRWLTGSVAVGTVAGLLLLDAGRQVMLARRIRRRPAGANAVRLGDWLP